MMGVLIKDMELPKNCLCCPMHNDFDGGCVLYSFGIPAKYNYVGATRPKWCELVEIPDKLQIIKLEEN